MVDTEGAEHCVQAYEIKQITGDLDPLHIPASIPPLFEGACRPMDIVRPHGRVDILLGIHHVGLHPVVADLQKQRVGGLRLLSS